jgi:Flp pilus assembly protein TadG
MKPNLDKRRKRQRGNAFIEAALAAPVMILMLSGVIDFGRAFYYADAAASAARAGAQYGIQSPANFNNYVGMQIAALNDVNASCTDSNGTSVSCNPSQSGQQAYIGPYKVSATASSYCKDSSGSTVACASSNARGYVKVVTSIPYSLIMPLPGLPNPLPIGGSAIMRTQ